MVSISSRSSGQDLWCLTAARKEGAGEGSRWCAPSGLHHFAACRVPLTTPKISDVRSDECASDGFIAAPAVGGVRQGWSMWRKDEAEERDLWKTRRCGIDGAHVYSWDIVRQLAGLGTAGNNGLCNNYRMQMNGLSLQSSSKKKRKYLFLKFPMLKRAFKSHLCVFLKASNLMLAGINTACIWRRSGHRFI